jgi:pSer/pThr/pTyr-binding forkhead associated (FHA) protein
VDQGDRYLQLVQLGRDGFLAASAPAALVRQRGDGEGSDTKPPPMELLDEETKVANRGKSKRGPRTVEVYPLAKKLGASFADMITVGRTDNNDVVLRDVTVSRFHAFFRLRGEKWVVADAGSKNGTALAGQPLEPRRERDLSPGSVVRIGDVELRFYPAAELYGVLGGT